MAIETLMEENLILVVYYRHINLRHEIISAPSGSGTQGGSIEHFIMILQLASFSNFHRKVSSSYCYFVKAYLFCFRIEFSDVFLKYWVWCHGSISTSCSTRPCTVGWLQQSIITQNYYFTQHVNAIWKHFTLTKKCTADIHSLENKKNPALKEAPKYFFCGQSQTFHCGFCASVKWPRGRSVYSSIEVIFSFI